MAALDWACTRLGIIQRLALLLTGILSRTEGCRGGKYFVILVLWIESARNLLRR